jgi:hypothetical protein
MSFQYSICPSNTRRVQNLILINKPSILGNELSQTCKLNTFLMPIFLYFYCSNLLQRTCYQGPQGFAHSPYWNLIFFSVPHVYATYHARLIHQL